MERLNDEEETTVLKERARKKRGEREVESRRGMVEETLKLSSSALLFSFSSSISHSF